MIIIIINFIKVSNHVAWEKPLLTTGLVIMQNTIQNKL